MPYIDIAAVVKAAARIGSDVGVTDRRSAAAEQRRQTNYSQSDSKPVHAASGKSLESRGSLAAQRLVMLCASSR
jgi:esterase/lipase superfamily enzyme